MANWNLLEQILTACAKLERGEISPIDFSDSVDNNANALEGISYNNMLKLRDLVGSIELAHYEYDDDKQPRKKLVELFAQFKHFVATLQ